MKLRRERVTSARHFEPLYDLLAHLEFELCYFKVTNTKKLHSTVFRNHAMKAFEFDFENCVMLPDERVDSGGHFELLYDLLASLELELCMIFGRKFTPNPGFRGASSNLGGATFGYYVFIFLCVSSGSSTPNTAENRPDTVKTRIFIITVSPLKACAEVVAIEHA